MLQNLLSLWKKKTHLVFCVFHFEQLSFFPYGCPVYVNIDQGNHKGKMKVALTEKQKKLHRLSFSIKIANFEAFL